MNNSRTEFRDMRVISNMSGIIRRHAPLFGQHTGEILSELGYSADRISALAINRVVRLPSEKE